MSGRRPLEVRIDLASPTPPFAQVGTQLAALIHSGALAYGDRLPTVRALAADLGVAPGTVARAYSELEADGLVLGRRRFGTTVVFAGGDSTDHPRLRAAARRFTATASADGHDRADILAAVNAALDELADQGTATQR